MTYRPQINIFGTIQAPMVLMNRKPASFTTYTRLALANRHVIGLPVTSPNLAAAGRIVTPKLDLANRRLLQFIHQTAPSYTPPSFATIDVWGIRAPLGTAEGNFQEKAPDEYLLERIFTLQTSGAGNGVNSASRHLVLDAANGFTAWEPVDSFPTFTDFSRGKNAIVYTDEPTGTATLDFDSMGYERLMFEITPSTGVGVHVKVGSL
jgi:hypothetical protein